MAPTWKSPNWLLVVVAAAGLTASAAMVARAPDGAATFPPV